jgi:hypothetical protein
MTFDQDRADAVRRAAKGGGIQKAAALLFLDQIKREKGVWWMPWQ